MKRILVICPKWTTDQRSPYLTNELVTELRSQGFEVDVVAFGEKSLKNLRDGNNEFIIGLTSSLRILKYMFVWTSLFVACAEIWLQKRRYDYLIHFAPLTVMLPAALMSTIIPITKKICIVFDIYPLHQIKIHVLPSFMSTVLHRIECHLIHNFDCITAMGPRNKSVISSYYKIPEVNHEVKVIPVWGAVKRYGHKRSELPRAGVINAVFGGQVIPGRRLDKLIDFLKLIRSRGVELDLTVFSNGPYYEKIQDDYCGETSWIHFRSNIPRDEYVSTISSFDVGTIVTDEVVPLPTFPSKIIDYISVGLHCFCMVEDQSDLEMVIGKSEFIHINYFKYDEGSVSSAVKFFRDLRLEPKTQEISRLIEMFSVNRAAAEILSP